jgi:hypothetical protein
LVFGTSLSSILTTLISTELAGARSAPLSLSELAPLSAAGAVFAFAAFAPFFGALAFDFGVLGA